MQTGSVAMLNVSIRNFVTNGSIFQVSAVLNFHMVDVLLHGLTSLCHGSKDTTVSTAFIYLISWAPSRFICQA